MPNNNKKNKKKKIKKTNNLTFKCTNICCQKNFYLKRIKLFYKSIKLNYIFWTTALVSVILISFYTNNQFVYYLLAFMFMTLFLSINRYKKYYK